MKRVERINSLIRDIAGQFFLTQIQIKNVIISVTRIETSSDLKNTKIFFAVFPEKEEKKILKLLKESRPAWQKYFASKFRAKFLPQAQFLIDKGEKSARRMEELLSAH